MMEKYDVFISYRRAGGSEKAQLVKSEIMQRGIEKDRVFLDTHMHSGDFEQKIKQSIQQSKHIVVIISKGCFDEARATDYWYMEIKEALAQKKDIIPIFFDGITKFDGLNIPSDLQAITKQNAITYQHEYADEVFNKLMTFLDHPVSPEPPAVPTASIWKTIGIGIFVLLFVFASFFSVGFAVGYFTNRIDAEEMMTNAFRSHQIVALDAHSIEYSGDVMRFVYDVQTNDVTYYNSDITFTSGLSFESVMMAVSIPIAFKNLLSVAKHSGNSRSKIVVLVAGSVGILCGYSIGKPVGMRYAMWQNERALEEYLRQEKARDFIIRKIENIYQ